MSRRKDSPIVRLLTGVAKSLRTPFWEDMRRVAITVMAVGMYAPIIYSNRWPLILLLPAWGWFLWNLAFFMEERSKTCT